MVTGNAKITAPLLALLGAVFCFAATGGAARADDDDEYVPVCPSLQELDTQMMSCEDNYYAAEKAEECAEKIKASWKGAAAILQTQLVTATENQSHSEKVAGADYKKALATLKAQIDYMQDGTDLVASYPQVMINFPDSNGEEAASLECFNEAFDTVQKSVSGLDDEILKAIDVYELAKNHKKVAGERQAGLDFSLVGGELGGKRKTASVPAGKSDHGASDVTGLKKGASLASTNTEKVEKVEKPESKKEAANGEEASARKAGSDVTESIGSSSFADRLEARQVARGAVELDPVTGLAREFSRNVAPVKAVPSAAGGSSEASVGAVLWKETRKTNFADTDFALAGGSAVTGVEATPISPASLRMAAIQGADGPAQLASPESDLFTLVRSRYRATELFRGSR